MSNRLPCVKLTHGSRFPCQTDTAKPNLPTLDLRLFTCSTALRNRKERGNPPSRRITVTCMCARRCFTSKSSLHHPSVIRYHRRTRAMQSMRGRQPTAAVLLYRWRYRIRRGARNVPLIAAVRAARPRTPQPRPRQGPPTARCVRAKRPAPPRWARPPLPLPPLRPP